MDSEKTPPPAQQSEPEIATWKRVTRFLTIPAGLWSGIWSMRQTVHNRAYETSKALGAYDDILAVMTPKSQENMSNLLAGNINTEEFWKRSMKLKAEFQHLGDERSKSIGLTSFLHKWQYMPRSAKQEAIINGITVSSVVVGAMIALSANKSFSELLGLKQDETPPGRQ